MDDYVEFRSYDSESGASHGARRLNDANIGCRVVPSGDSWALQVHPGSQEKAEGVFEAYDAVTQLPPQGTPEDQLPWMKRPGAWIIIFVVVALVFFLIWKPWLWPFYVVVGLGLGVVIVVSRRSSPDRF
jgi:hypothetical protein